jgi:hypothetical protein
MGYFAECVQLGGEAEGIPPYLHLYAWSARREHELHIHQNKPTGGQASHRSILLRQKRVVEVELHPFPQWRAAGLVNREGLDELRPLPASLMAAITTKAQWRMAVYRR